MNTKVMPRKGGEIRALLPTNTPYPLLFTLKPLSHLVYFTVKPAIYPVYIPCSPGIFLITKNQFQYLGSLSSFSF